MFDTLLGALSGPGSEAELIGVGGAGQACVAARVHRDSGRPVVALTAEARQAERFFEDIKFFMGADAHRACYFPAYNLSPFKFISYHSQTAAQRIRALWAAAGQQGAAPLLVTPVEGLMQRILPRRELVDFAELVMAGEELDRDAFIAKLVAGGYAAAAVVEEPGDFCARGGIVDLFTPLYTEPLRIEFFGDTVDSLRFFSPASQRSTRRIGEAVILPAREAIITDRRRDAIAARVRLEASRLEMPVTRMREVVERLRREAGIPGADGLLPLIYDELDTLFDYLPAETLFVVCEPRRLAREAGQCEERAAESFAEASEAKRLCVAPERLMNSWPGVEQRLGQWRRIMLRSLPVVASEPGRPPDAGWETRVEDNSGLRAALAHRRGGEDLLSPLVQWLQEKLQAALTTVLVCPSRKRAERLAALLKPYGLQPLPAGDFTAAASSPGALHISRGQVSAGFVWPQAGLAVLPEHEIFGARQRIKRRRSPAARAQLLAVEDLRQADLVVHEDHGIGRYEGLVKLKVNGAVADFLLILYRDEDKLYVPVDRMGAVRKYMGVANVQPALDKMGGKSWERVKNRVKRSAERIAGELLKLYATRKTRNGYAFEPVVGELESFEADFAYEETPDQRRAIEDVIDDMQAPTPMDRLVCGDVGYGKTEVALRASFLCVFNGRQVAMLVPTTVLAEQHYETFASRYARFPVKVACLSRFRSAAEQRRILRELAGGQLDIVIGTHRLLSRDVAFKDLGLLVIDEEQRFGVKHKEKLKRWRSTVDVLALTATPIPRTLHMSLTGVRDISVIATPPEYRRAIVTYVAEPDDAVVAEAVRRELHRGGQIFFVHNSIRTLKPMAARLQRLVPEVRLAAAHGRMDEESLEEAMYRFLRRQVDMLVCTTIVESGLDIPAANTILINRADKFGLAQIYQLRGRVGRSDEQAYAYLFIPAESDLGDEARKRLKVLMEHSDLGSGFQIAMSDLQIRGGGTILGASQSGHIAAVGYDMFLQLMEEAVREIKGEPPRERLEPEINLPLSAFLPEEYMPNIDQRLSAYRRLARMTAAEDIAAFKAELGDRYGPLPAEAANLLSRILLRVLALKAGVKKLDLAGNQLNLCFSENHVARPEGIAEVVANWRPQGRLTPEGVLKLELRQRGADPVLVQARNILQEIARRVNN